MILKSFLLGNLNLVSLCMKIINSVVVVGLYYGFLTAFSAGPSYFFLLRDHLLEEGEEGTKKVAATTGFLMGQLVMFISIYYAPLHLALSRPHTITVLVLPYLLFPFFVKYFNYRYPIRNSIRTAGNFGYTVRINRYTTRIYGSTTRNSMRDFSIQWVFLNNLIFQLFNHFFLPSSVLARLVNIYIFRCNNKMLFVTSSFVGWLIGHILFMKWVGFVLVWIRKNYSIRSKKYIRSNKYIRIYKYLVSELRYSTTRIFTILFVFIFVNYLGRMPSPIVTRKLKETSVKTEEGDVEKKIVSETKGTKQEQEGSTEEDPSPSPLSSEKGDPDKIDETEEIRVNGKEKTKNEFDPTPLVTLLFDYKRWNRPSRYIENNQFNGALRKEASQYFFDIGRSDGKERIYFTYPPSLSTFREMIERRISLEKLSSDQLYNDWVYTNNHKHNNLLNEFKTGIKQELINRKKKNFKIQIEKRTRLCKDETKKYYLPKMYDPFLNGPYRGTINKLFSSSIRNETSIENCTETIEKNKIHGILLDDSNSREFEQKMEISEKKQGRIDSDNRVQFLFNAIITDGIKEIGTKKGPVWSYKLITELEEEDAYTEESVPEEHQIRIRKFKKIVIADDSKKEADTDPNSKENIKKSNDEEKDEEFLIHFFKQPDYRRGIIKGSMRPQRRKTTTGKLFQPRAHSPLFFHQLKIPIISTFVRMLKIFFRLLKPLFRNWIDKQTKLQILDSTEKQTNWGRLKSVFRNWMVKLEIFDSTKEQTKRGKKKEKYKKEKYKKEMYKKESTKEEMYKKESMDEETEKKTQIVYEADQEHMLIWEYFEFGPEMRSLLMYNQPSLRRQILIPSLIIAKNLGRMLFFQRTEWPEDFEELNRETYLYCTYNGVPFPENKLPEDWLSEGIQIKVLFPFRLKPWHSDPKIDEEIGQEEGPTFCFLTAFGFETDRPFGHPQTNLSISFFKPILKEVTKIIIKLVRQLIIKFQEKNFLVLKEINKKFEEANLTRFFRLRKVDELKKTKKEKDSIISNQIIHESFSQIGSTNSTNYSPTEEKMKNLIDRTSTIRTKIEQIRKERQKVTSGINNSPNKKNKNNKVESPKNIWQILKRRNVRLRGKFSFFIKIFIEQIYIKIILYSINSPIIGTELFFEFKKNIIESTKKILNEYIYKKKNQERINKKKKNTMHYISTIEKSISKNKSHSFCDLSSLSQAYVFYKLSQTQVTNSDKLRLRSVLQYRGTSFFLKTAIKDSFERQGIFHSELGHKKLGNFGLNRWKNWLKGHYPNYRTKQWKNWLRGHYQYQYNLSQIGWYKFRLISQKWRNGMNQRHTSQNKDLNKWDSYKKDQLLDSKNQNDSKVYLLANVEDVQDNFPKIYRYDLLAYQFLSYKSIQSETKNDSYIYGLPFPVNKNRDISYDSTTHKNKLFDIYYKDKFLNILKGFSVRNYLVKGDIIYTEKNPDRKYYYKIDNYQRIDKIHNESIFSLRIHSNAKINPLNHKKSFFDWMGMNEEILNRPISTLESWFFPEFVILYNTYKLKPWVIPNKLLLFNFNENISENKNTKGKQKENFFRPSKEKQHLELKNQNQDEKEPASEENLGYVLSNHEKDIEEDGEQKDIEENNKKKEMEEDYAESVMKKKSKKKKKQKTQLDFFVERFFLCQLKSDQNMYNDLSWNLKMYNFMEKKRNPGKLIFALIRRQDLDLETVSAAGRQSSDLEVVIKENLFAIEPIRLSVKNNGQFIMYQTIGISLVHKSQHRTLERYLEQKYFDKNNLDESIPRRQRITSSGEKNDRYFCFLVPESFLSPRRRRELRILQNFNLKNRNDEENKTKIPDEILKTSKCYERNELKLIQIKSFLWPNFRLEDLACMNRFWFNTNNGSRFSMLRIYMYPRFQIK
uniref:Protein TIC 214 n=1 Tax=Carpodetus archboldianus TaxID=2886864 RepID=A0A8K1UDH6_9ASTR|nr:Ycf1 protein [Carpodetus archboldianus]